MRNCCGHVSLNLFIGMSILHIFKNSAILVLQLRWLLLTITNGYAGVTPGNHNNSFHPSPNQVVGEKILPQRRAQINGKKMEKWKEKPGPPHQHTQRLFGLSRLSLSRFIFSYRILFILSTLYYLCGQPKGLTIDTDTSGPV